MGDPSVLKLLLDTHIWLWSLLEPKNLSRKVILALESPKNELWLSPMSTWEFLVLVEKGRVVLNIDAEAWLDEALSKVPLREAPLTYEICRESRLVRLPHQDPVDCFLAATAKVLELTLVTSDQRLLRTCEFRTFPNSK